ncbi:MAG TPA: BlaI/MecI/CopY family transcriptional regulator [Rhodanobacteraceae bacterium]|nr:BlaI/MecI/CopY family transcriptional regulator [Rhodanobacteraceae bacterium]
MTPISEAESRVMQVLWQRAPQSADDIIQALAKHTPWQDKTVKTLLNRLLRKGAIHAERDGRRYLYTPLLKREDWQAEESRSLLDRVFDGRLAPMLTHFSRHEKLSGKDLRELRKLVDAIEQSTREKK